MPSSPAQTTYRSAQNDLGDDFATWSFPVLSPQQAAAMAPESTLHPTSLDSSPGQVEEEAMRTSFSYEPAMTASFWSPIGQLHHIPLTPWSEPYGGTDESVSAGAAQTWSVPPPRIDTTISQAHPQSLSARAETGLSPLFAGFTAQSPTSAQSLQRPSGPMRHRSYDPNTGGRRRSSTLMSSVASSSPATPFSTLSSYYPYPSPRSSVSGHSTPATFSCPVGPGQEARPSLRYHPGPPTAHTSHSQHMSSAQLYDESTYAQTWDGLNGLEDDLAEFHKAPPSRFKPTKEQLEILIGVYNQNKNPDASMREMLVERLGGGIKAKTLQIWFQNRRSKAKAKERDFALLRPAQMRGRSSLTGCSPQSGTAGLDPDLLRKLAHDDNPNLLMVPLSVLMVNSWSRFLTPGIGHVHPDLACAIQFNTIPSIYFYVTHKNETYRMVIPIDASAIGDIRSTTNIHHNADAIAITFDLYPGIASFCSWSRDPNRPLTGTAVGGWGWRTIADFTSGAASSGGKCELTGDRQILTPAFGKIESMLVTTASMDDWRLPPVSQPMTTSTSLDVFSSPHAPALAVVGVHGRHRSLSAPQPPILPHANFADQGSMHQGEGAQSTVPNCWGQQAIASSNFPTIDLGSVSVHTQYQSFAAIQMKEAALASQGSMSADSTVNQNGLFFQASPTQTAYTTSTESRADTIGSA